MRPLTQEEAVELQQQGHDPAGWVVDDNTNEYVYQGVESPNALAEFGKAVVRGGGQGIGGDMQFQGRVNQLMQDYTSIPMSPVPGAVGNAVVETTQRIAPRGDMSDRPIAQFFAQDFGEGVGQLGTMLIPSVFASRIGSLGGRLVSRIAPGLIGGLAEAEDTAARAVEEGQSPEAAIVKGLASGAVAGGLEQAIGAGRLARKITGGETARGAGEFVKNRFGDAWRGGAEEGAARAFQDAIVSGKLSWDEILREAAVGGVLQSSVGGAIDVATKGQQPPVIDTDDFETEGTATQTDVDITKTPWKTTPMTETYKRNLIESETWDPVIKTDFDVAVNDAKKRKILTPEIVDALYNSDKPQELLDQIVREGVQPPRQVTPLTDAEIDSLRNIGPDDNPPVMTPLLRGVLKARKAGMNLSANDYQQLNALNSNERVDAYINAKYLETKQNERPMSAAEAAASIRDRRYERIRKVLPQQISNLEKVEKNAEMLGKQVEKADLTAGERWQMAQQLAKLKKEADQLRVEILREYLSEYEETPMTLEREGPPLAEPPIINIDTGAPPPPQGPPSAGQPSGVAPTAAAPEQAALPASSQQRLLTQGTGPILMPGIPPTQAEFSAALQEYAQSLPPELQPNDLSVPGTIAEMSPTLRRLLGEYREAVEGEQRSPFVEQAQATGSPNNLDIQPPKTAGEIPQPAQATIATAVADPQRTVENEAVKPAGRLDVSETSATEETGLAEADLSPGAEFHSGFGGSAAAGVWRAIQKSGFGLEYVQKLTRAVKDVLALQGESGAYVAAWIQPLITEQTRLKNVSLKSAQKYEKLLKDTRFIKWINHSADTKTEDYSKLPVELRAQAKRLRQHLIAYQNIQNKEGIMVQEMDLAGNKRLRPAQQLPGWFPFRVKDAVYNDFKRESHIRQRRSEWMRNAEKHIGDRPNWKEQAEAAFDRIQQVNKRVDTIGEPLFKAVDTEHSWPLPPEWRDDNLTSGLYRYADKWSKHIAWEKIIGKNPILRKILNIPEGPAGELTKDDAPQKWSEVPQQYATAVEMGKRSFANWTDNVDLNRTIEPIKDPTPVNMFIASYAQKPIGAYERVNDVVNAASQLAGSMMMQTPTGLRDLGTAMTGVWGYVPLKDMARAVGGFIDAIASPVKTIEKAQKAGAAPLDVFTLQSGEAITRDFMDALTKGEVAQRVANVLYKSAQMVRTFTGRNFMDSWGRAIIYNTVAEVSKYNKQHGLKDSLTEEFVPLEVREKLSPQEQVDATAAAIVERLAPRYDAASLPAGMLPQNRTLLSSALSLLKFPISRFNNWYKDEWMPAMHGKPQRLIRSLLLMGVSSQIIGELIALLTDRRPQELTWAEYLRMPEGIVENKDLAAMIFYNLQMQGYYGLAGDAANVIARRVAGRPTDLGKATELAYPPAIVWNELYPKVMSFLEAAQTGTLGVDDIAQMGWEFLSANQNMKVFNAWADAKPEYRDRMIFEQLYQASAKTAEPINKRTRSNFATPDPFSLNNRLMRIDDIGDLRRLLPEIQARPNPIQIQPQLMSEYYYAELAMRRGKKEALKQLEADREREEKRQLIQSLR